MLVLRESCASIALEGTRHPGERCCRLDFPPVIIPGCVVENPRGAGRKTEGEGEGERGGGETGPSWRLVRVRLAGTSRPIDRCLFRISFEGTHGGSSSLPVLLTGGQVLSSARAVLV